MEPTPERIDEVFAAQRARRWDIAASDAEARIGRLLRLREAIVARRDRLAAAVHADFRKHAAEFELTELHPTLEEIDHAVAHLDEWMAPEVARTPLVLLGTRSEVRHEPRGVVLILAPWNYPFFLLLTPLIAAIAAGNVAILKPSHKTPHMAAELAELIAAVFPVDEVALFQGGGALGDRLLALPFDHIFFTGGAAVGRKVMAAAAKHLATVTLELGGKSPAIVDASADVEASARRIVWGKFINAGQTCVAPDYALVHASKYDEFLAAASAAIAAAYGETPEARRRSGDLARMIDDHAFARLDGLLRRSVEVGARIVTGGEVEASDRYIAPTVLADVTPNMPIMDDEIFGPILPVLRYETHEEAIALIRGKDKPLALYIFAEDRAATTKLLAQTSAGGTVINNTILHLANPNLPFGGVGASGMGNYHGRWGFVAFSHARAVLTQRGGALASFFYPPYDTTRSKLAARGLRALE
jgi:aldehyde dehydrogenase (NAD+)